jgi:hypothetical protein
MDMTTDVALVRAAVAELIKTAERNGGIAALLINRTADDVARIANTIEWAEGR